MKFYPLVIASLLLSLLLLPAAAAQMRFQENVSYARITPAQPTENPDKVEVIEVFWYGCPHCHRFQPYIDRWLLVADSNVEFIRLPAILNESWAIHARAYYTAEVLGVTEKIHMPLFNAIHNEKRRLNTERDLMEFFARHGDVDNQQFRNTFNSFAVDSKVERARSLTRRYGIEGTPAVVVNGKYRTGPAMTGSFETLIDVMDFLVRKEIPASAN